MELCRLQADPTRIRVAISSMEDGLSATGMVLWKKVMGGQMGHQYDLLLGRKTYEIFAGYWPKAKDNLFADKLNKAKKYVVSKTLKKLGSFTLVIKKGSSKPQKCEAVVSIKQACISFQRTFYS